MNRKLLTALAVLTVVIGLSVAGAASAMEADAETSGSSGVRGDVTPIPANGKDSNATPLEAVSTNKTTATVDVQINLPVNDAGVKHVPLWYVKDSNNAYVQMTWSSDHYTGTIPEGKTVDIAPKPSGKYTITITSTDLDKTKVTGNLAFELVTIKGDGPANADPTKEDFTYIYFAQHLYYSISTKYSVAADSFTVSGASAMTQFADYTADLATLCKSDVPAGSTWYAKGLPEGLSMTTKGVISGVPIAPSFTGPINVSAVDPNGNNHYSAWTPTYNAAASADVKIKANATSSNVVKLGTVDVSGSGVIERQIYKIGSADNNLKFNIEATSGDITDYTVKLVSWDGGTQVEVKHDTSASVDDSSHKYCTVPITGVGEFFIEVHSPENADSKKVLSILVISEITEVKAGIAFDIVDAS